VYTQNRGGGSGGTHKIVVDGVGVHTNRGGGVWGTHKIVVKGGLQEAGGGGFGNPKTKPIGLGLHEFEKSNCYELNP